MAISPFGRVGDQRQDILMSVLVRPIDRDHVRSHRGSKAVAAVGYCFVDYRAVHLGLRVRDLSPRMLANSGSQK